MPSLPAIARINKPSRRAFVENHLKPGIPVLMDGLMDDWPACRKWSLDYFRELGGNRCVRVEHGNVYHEAPHFERVNLKDYLNYIECQLPTNSYADLPSRGTPVQYLANFDIFGFFPEFRKDVSFSLWKGRKAFPIGWIGPPGSFSGLHWDILSNLFAQIRGKKEFLLYAPNQSSFLYPSKKYDTGSFLSSVDSRNPDYGRFPLFAKAQGRRVIVEAGQMLFIPRGWWHQVCGLEASISISCFGVGIKDALLYAFPGWVREFLHKAGVYREGNCACHRKRME